MGCVGGWVEARGRVGSCKWVEGWGAAGCKLEQVGASWIMFACPPRPLSLFLSADLEPLGLLPHLESLHLEAEALPRLDPLPHSLRHLSLSCFANAARCRVGWRGLRLRGWPHLAEPACQHKDPSAGFAPNASLL